MAERVIPVFAFSTISFGHFNLKKLYRLRKGRNTMHSRGTEAAEKKIFCLLIELLFPLSALSAENGNRTLRHLCVLSVSSEAGGERKGC